MLGNDFNVFHLARAAVPAGQMAGNGHDKFNAACLQSFHVLLRGCIFPHASVHRGRNQNGRSRGHHSGGKHIIRNAAGHLADDVRRRGRNQK